MEFQKINLKDKYPIEKIEILKKDCKINSFDELISKIKNKIEGHRIASFISIFDNFQHTKNIKGVIDDKIKNGKIILFCFGKSLNSIEILAVRPRNIAIIEFENKFEISFLEAPNEDSNIILRKWILEVIKDE